MITGGGTMMMQLLDNKNYCPNVKRQIETPTIETTGSFSVDLMICECIANVIRFYLLLVIRFEILKENSDEMRCNNGSVVLVLQFMESPGVHAGTLVRTRIHQARP